MHQLLLQVLRVRGDDHGLTRAQGPEDRGHEVCQGLADAGARLDKQELLLAQSLGDLRGHLHLAGAVFVCRQCVFDGAARRQRLC